MTDLYHLVTHHLSFVELFEKCFENGYADSEYVTWLQIFHPSSLPSPVDLFLSVSPHDQIDSPGEF